MVDHAQACSQNLSISRERRTILCVEFTHDVFGLLIYGSVNAMGQFLTTVHPGDIVGEIGVLCYIPQPFTVCTRKLSQVLRLDRSVFMCIVQSFPEDGQRIVDNLLQVSNFVPHANTQLSFQILIS